MQTSDESTPWCIDPPNERFQCWGIVSHSTSGGMSRMNFGSEDEARARYAEMEAIGRCRECGDVLNDHYMEPYKAQIRSEQTCFRCLHWLSYVATKSDPTHVVVNANHYVISPDQPKGYQGCVGHGGAEFVIRFADGREVVSRNLWAQGVVPERFRERLPNNAEFVTRGTRRVGNWPGAGGFVGVGSADGAL